jgi:hypothetical protein
MNRPLFWLILVQLIGNALLLGLGYYWLGIGESSGSMLALSIAVVLIFTLGAVWLHGGALAYFREAGTSARDVFVRVLRHLPPLLLLATGAFALYVWLTAWNPSPTILSIASFLTMTFQKPVRPGVLLQIWQVLLWLLLWCVLPVLLLPLASGIAHRNWRGFGEFGAQLRDWKYWLLIPVILLGGIWLPLWLIGWVPVRGAFALELASLILRFGVGYLLFVAACLALAFVTSRGRSVLSQPSTVSSP